MDAVDKIERPKRKFLPDTFSLTDWSVLKPWFDNLLERTLQSAGDLRTWFKDRSELEAVVAEDFAWRYINMTRFTENEDYSKSYQYFVENIQPQIAPISDQLNRKAEASVFLAELEKETGYDIMIRNLRKEIELFREVNIPLFTEISLEQQKYNQLSGAMMVKLEGKELTLQQAAVRLMSTDRAEREQVYRKITDRRLQDKETLDKLFTKLIHLRHQIAVNAGFSNFRDYMFKAMGRFDYTPQDCFNFHDSIASEVVPMLNDLTRERKESLGVASLKPWDKIVDPEGRDPLKAFNDGNDLTGKTIECFHRINTYLGQCLAIMKEMGHLDLESRKGKAPGGYNYPLAEIGVPFIFMNATSTLRDMVTIMHEGGHAVHNFLTRELELNDFKSTPSEVAELASMSMELISMDHWDIFFPDAETLKRAKREHLEDIIETLPWVATIDKFQHWVYENPNHSVEERKASWNRILTQFSDSITDWTGEEIAKDYLWQKQLHLYEVPFYYIEYGMAQLGAIAIWRNYKHDKQKGLQGYMNALKLGYMKSIPEVYEAAGIRFDFSSAYIRELMAFVRTELQKVS
ncbi:MAG: M3 family oligoendopeptidase [Cyclobacteriaceae bacterium]|nr:M3 family oligoendopeptidase [Cyclobacteriaceae bacterium]